MNLTVHGGTRINVVGNLYAVEPNHGELDKITPSGTVSRIIDISAAEGHIVPTALVAHDGLFYTVTSIQFLLRRVVRRFS